MEIRLESLNNSAYDVREEVDDDHVEEIAESLEADGQWNPIIVRPDENGSYDVIAGHTRYRAAERLGWDSLEATVKDLDDTDAEELALKTNLKREPMSKIAEGKVINDILDEHDMTQQELAEQLGKSKKWVSDRVKVALDLEPEVKGLVEEGELSYTLARVVRQVEADRQLEFAKRLIEQSVTNETKATQVRRRFENDTIHTVGYEGREFGEFVELLDEAGVEILVDVRASGDSTYKPAFGADMLAQRLPEHGIDYRHEPELGVHRMIRNPYKDGAVGHDCFESWYDWWLDTEADIDLTELADELVETGTPALMCIEHSPEPTDDQEIYCHRHHLAERLRSVEDDGRRVFPNRSDL